MSDSKLRTVADFFVTNGFQAAGYTYVSTDDGWMGGRNASGHIFEDPTKFPTGIASTIAYIHSRGLKFGIYSAASSVVCSGRVGSLFVHTNMREKRKHQQ